MKNLIIHLKYLFKDTVFIGFFLFTMPFTMAEAGSYDDFFKAIRQDDAPAIKTLLLRGFDPNTLDPMARHGLTIALSESALKAAEALLDARGVDVNWLNAQGESPLMYAALKGHLALAQKLIDRDADVNKTGWTPLHYAATKGDVGMIRLLLNHHAFVDSESPNGSTPLMMAAQYGTLEAVKLLLEEGAEPAQKNEQSLTALDFARRASRQDAVDLIAAAMRKRQPAASW
jgi:ankyrin repeat protein